jgi:protein-disulfide isomerase
VTNTRRDLLERTTALVLGAAFLAGGALPAGLGFVRPVRAQAPSEEELMLPGPLGDLPLGSAQAPCTIIEYASLTSGPCAVFATKAYPVLKERYIDTGKVRFILRAFPLDPLAEAGFMLARCADTENKGDKYHAAIKLLFQHQKDWVVRQPLEALLTISGQMGFSRESFEACLSDQQLLDGIRADHERAAAIFGVNSAPTFFINGRVYRGVILFDEFEKLIQPYVKS